MMFNEIITKSETEIIERAIEILKKHKDVVLILYSFNSKAPGVADTSQAMIEDLLHDTPYPVYIPIDLFTAQRLSTESKSLSFDDIVALRLAKLIFETYKIEEQNKLDKISNTVSIDGTNLYNTIYSQDINLNGISLNATITDVDELKNKLSDLQTEKDNLEQELQRTKSIVDILLQKCQEKGIL